MPLLKRPTNSIPMILFETYEIKIMSKAKKTTKEQVEQNKQPRIHLVAQGKGGAGKTFVASLLCQNFIRSNTAYKAFDLDPVNRSLTAISGLNVESWKVLQTNADIDPVKFDELVEVIYQTDKDIILDLGATSFLPFNSYLVQNRIFELLRTSGNIKVIIHCVIRGGSSLIECLNGLKKLCTYYSADDTHIVVWLNEVEGEISRDGKTFEEMKIYNDIKNRIARIVIIPEMKDYLHRHDMIEILKRNQMFDSAISSAKTGIVSKMRIQNLKKTFCDIAAEAIEV